MDKLLCFYHYRLFWLAHIFLLILFQKTLVSNTASLSRLSAAQRSNIELAAQKLNGVIIKQAETFSFNSRVGPRIARMGYVQAPSYLEGETPATFGGGICLFLSSLTYKCALELGLPINERTAHTRTTQCIASGFDATVWYGHNDLRFTNNLNMPIKMESKFDGQNLSLRMIGQKNKSTDVPIKKLQRMVNRYSDDIIEVLVFRQETDKLALVSRDRYQD